jgi:hypothetical protein
MAWAEYTYKQPENIQDIVNQFIWLNSHIKINGKPTFHRLMYTSGIKYIKQLLDPNGNILQYQDFMTKYNIHIHFLNYYSIINAIPQQWKVKIATGDCTIEIMNTNYKFSVEKILNTRNKLCKLVY